MNDLLFQKQNICKTLTAFFQEIPEAINEIAQAEANLCRRAWDFMEIPSLITQIHKNKNT